VVLSLLLVDWIEKEQEWKIEFEVESVIKLIKKLT